MNTGRIPGNGRHPGAPFTVFYIIVALSVLVAIGVLALFRWWQIQAKKRFSRRM